MPVAIYAAIIIPWDIAQKNCAASGVMKSCAGGF
jgi:hypothetical protein